MTTDKQLLAAQKLWQNNSGSNGKQTIAAALLFAVCPIVLISPGITLTGFKSFRFPLTVCPQNL
ncbi:MAG: hypothetical protein WBL85_00150 [Sedimentisphaerales bacterium]